MNKRIRELAEQAEIKFESHPQHQGVDTAVIIPTDLEKFAELIVRECMEVAHPKLTDVGEWAAGIRLVQKRLKQHFGVEEE
jgi:hypothetical protein